MYLAHFVSAFCQHSRRSISPNSIVRHLNDAADRYQRLNAHLGSLARVSFVLTHFSILPKQKNTGLQVNCNTAIRLDMVLNVIIPCIFSMFPISLDLLPVFFPYSDLNLITLTVPSLRPCYSRWRPCTSENWFSVRPRPRASFSFRGGWD